MESLPGIWSLSPLGALIGVVILVYWLLASGRLIPKSSHERELAVQKTRGDEWKETALEERRTRRVIEQQNSSLIEQLGVVKQLIQASAPSLGDTTQGGGS